MLHWNPKKERREGERERGREREREREGGRESERGNQYLCSYWPLFFQEFSDGREETSI